jgi:hypothetical protein
MITQICVKIKMMKQNLSTLVRNHIFYNERFKRY